MIWSNVTPIVIGLVIVAVLVWALRGRPSGRRPDAGPTIPDLSVATEIQRLEQLRDAGEITEAEFRAAKSKLLS